MEPAPHHFRFTFLSISALAAVLLLAVSCMKDKPEALPSQLEWNPELAFPLGSKSIGMNTESGFDTTLYETDTITGLPEWVDEFELVMEGSVDFDLYNLTETPEELNHILFRINIYNGFPNEVLSQGYFLDGSSSIVDSMFAGGPVTSPPGQIQGNGDTINPSHVVQDALFDRDRIDPLRGVTAILFQATMINPEIDTSLIPYYPSYELEVDLGTMIDLTMQF